MKASDLKQVADDSEFVAYLEETLIPDLRESGHECTAEDFERCVAIIRRLAKKWFDADSKKKSK